MATIPEETKVEIKNSGAKFNRNPAAEATINSDILAIAKRAVGNAILDNEPYTIRINFQNGRIVGKDSELRLSVELLDGRASTPSIGVPTDSSVTFIRLDSLVTEGFPPITNEGSWVARVKIENGMIKTVFVNRDFSEEDREIIKTALLRGFDPQIQM